MQASGSPAGAHAEAELAPPAELAFGARRRAASTAVRWHTARASRCGPDVAAAFDRMQGAARRDGISLVVVSGFRSNAEQAALFARHPDPKWVAPPGRSLHRLGTELDLGPPAAYELAERQRQALSLYSEIFMGAMAFRLYA